MKKLIFVFAAWIFVSCSNAPYKAMQVEKAYAFDAIATSNPTWSIVKPHPDQFLILDTVLFALGQKDQQRWTADSVKTYLSSSDSYVGPSQIPPRERLAQLLQEQLEKKLKAKGIHWKWIDFPKCDRMDTLLIKGKGVFAKNKKYYWCLPKSGDDSLFVALDQFVLDSKLLQSSSLNYRMGGNVGTLPGVLPMEIKTTFHDAGYLKGKIVVFNLKNKEVLYSWDRYKELYRRPSTDVDQILTNIPYGIARLFEFYSEDLVANLVYDPSAF